ncbi:Integrase [Actinidia chinensis var. chinensis]|uniref:Integrase n=1 Tax=Actinidia chinensis var. chinensis TaxID=1590841 RepID=A0A2R6QH95_ACTCC|nr:Integrase [Actinidia chinensis var. chinensis]
MAEKDTQIIQDSAKPEANKYDNPNDHFYLHHSDQPGFILVMQLLTEENYNTWSRVMLMALSIKNKEGFINNTIRQLPITSVKELQQWRRYNNLVMAWLFNSTSEDIKASSIYNESAYKIWSDLKECFSCTNSVHLFHVEEAIHDCKEDNMTIGAYYTKLKGFWDECDTLCCIPTCTCGTVKEVLQFQQSQKNMKFLMGLNEAYAAVRGQILLMDPLPIINKAHSFILQDEKQTFTPKNPYLKCGICDKLGHTSETCRAHLKCDYCGCKGYTIDVCRKLQKTNSAGGKSDQEKQWNFPSKVNHVNTNATATPTSSTLMVEQYQNLMTMLNGNKPNSMVNHVGSASAMSDLSGPTIGEDDWDEN